MISALPDVPTIGSTHSSSSLLSSLMEQCREVLGRLFPDANVHETRIEPCTGGITNKLFKAVVRDDHGAAQSVLVRIYGRGTDAIIDRDTELRNARLLGERGLAGRLYGTFDNGLVYEYIEGRALACDELPLYTELIARELARWHSIRPVACGGDHGRWLFTTLRRWLDKVHPEDLDDASRSRYRHYIDALEHRHQDAAVVLCHNDVLSANIILCPGAQSVKFIDYEYSAFSVPAFDLANHFCEYAGFDCDWDRLPGDEQMARFVRAYDPLLAPATVDEWVGGVREWMPAAHLFWGLWGLIQSRLSDIDFDYAAYARRRLAMVPLAPVAPQ